MNWVLIVLGGLVVLVTVIAVVGAVLPRRHVASRTLKVGRPPAEVWALVSDFGSAAAWRKDVKRIERLPDRDGRAAWIEHGSSGPVPLEVVAQQAPHRLVTRIAESEKMFGGTWTYQIAATDRGSTLTITEDGWVGNPIFRFVSHFFFDQHATMDGYLKSVAARFNEDPQLSGE